MNMTDAAQIAVPSLPSVRGYKAVSSWFFPHPIVWIACVLLVIAEIFWLPFAGFTLQMGDTVNEFVAGTALLFTGIALSRFHWHRLSILAFSLAFFSLSARPANVAVYLIHDLSFPWVDAQLAYFDSLVGFNWLAQLAWINEHQTVARILRASYEMIMSFMLLTGISLLLLNKLEKLRELIMTYAISLSITIFIGAFLPARGAFFYHQPTADLLGNIPSKSGRDFLDHMISLHDGTLKVVSFDQMVGLITFPSFHMVMALLMMWATWRTIVFPIFVLFNILMAIATPVFGGHYFVDLIGGLVITALSIWIYYLWSGRKLGDVSAVS